jgi:hypothetical protein
MKTLNRPIRQEDLQPKGFPFACDNCGNKPTPQQVVDHHGDCEICGDTIITYTVDAAELLILHNSAVRMNNPE